MERVNALILKRADSHVEMVPELARYLIEAGGKRLRPLLTLSFLAGYEDRDYDDIDRTDKNTTVGLGLENQFTRHWIGRFDYQYLERDSNQAGRDYEANSFLLTMIYRR